METIFYYSVPSERGPQVFEFSWDSICSYDVTDFEDAYIVAKRAAKDFYHNRGGYSAQWPLTIHLHPSPQSAVTLKYTVSVEKRIEFNVSEVL